jgi:hypothetical protein
MAGRSNQEVELGGFDRSERSYRSACPAFWPAAGRARRLTKETPKGSKRSHTQRRHNGLVGMDLNIILGCLPARERSRSGDNENGSQTPCPEIWCAA